MLVDGEVVAREILVMWKRKGTRGFMWKVDFAEANYLLDMDFLWMSMTKRGFLTKWVVWVKKCFTSHSFLVLVNWHPLKGGDREGMPHCSFPFHPCSGCPLYMYYSSLGIPLLQYVDDAMFLMEGSMEDYVVGSICS